MKYVLRGILLLAFIAGTAAEGFPPPRPGLVDPVTGRFRTTGQPVPTAPKAVSKGRPSSRGGLFPFLLGASATGQSAVGPLAIDPSRDSVVRPLVLLVDFADRPHASPNADNTAVEALFFGAGPSVAAYYNEVSYGRFAVARPSTDNAANPDVVGWLRAVPIGTTPGPGEFVTTITSSESIAGVSVANVRALIIDAVRSIPAGFDFSPYVRTSDNTIVSVILVHPGTGAEDTGDTLYDPYSHTAQLSFPIRVGPYSIRDYTIVPSRQYYNDPTRDPRPGTLADPNPEDDPLVGIGVIVHEMGHLLGLPDLYPTAVAGQTTGAYSGVGVFDLMGYGLWGSTALARADNPAHLSAWAKAELGWLSPALLSATQPGAAIPAQPTLPPAETTASAYKIHPNGPGDQSLYFLVENRSDVASALFDKALPLPGGSPPGGLLIWRVDNERFDAWRQSSVNPLLRPNTVNNDSAFLALSVMEAHLDNSVFGRVPDLIKPFDVPGAFGDFDDFWTSSGQVFSRTSPVDGLNETNSAPIVASAPSGHKGDSGFLVTLWNFARSALDFLFDLVVELPYWKAFRSTDPPPTLNTDRVVAYGFDGSNRVWIGTADRGVWIYALTTWTQIDTFRSHRIQAMAFEARTGGMWVGTDNSLEKVRLDRIIATFPDPVQYQGFPALNVRAIAIDRASKKWIGGSLIGTAGNGELAAIFDPGNNLPSDFLNNFAATSHRFSPGLEAGETITSLAFDNVFSTDPALDVLYVGTSHGRIFRNVDSSGNVRDLYSPSLFNVLTPLFEPVTYPINAPSPAVIYAMGVDTVGILWAATDRGVFAFDRGDPSALPQLPDLYNPFDLAGDGVLTNLAYFPRSFTASGIVPTGIAFQDTAQARRIVWVSCGDPVSSTEQGTGGAVRIDPNALINASIPRDPAPGVDPLDAARVGHAIMAFDRAIPSGPAVGSLRDLLGVAGDGASNVWFATKNSGAVRFGSGTVLTLDKSSYVNESAIANVLLLDENSATETLLVRVISASDPAGFDLVLDRGTDNIYRGSFGFTTGATDNVAGKIKVANGAMVTVTYRDVNPPSVVSAFATWKSVYPFEDDLWIGSLCFVATAAYGSPMAPEVETLRRFRDRCLVVSGPGRLFVSLYYRLSPPLAAVIARSPALRAAARFALVPAVCVASFAAGAGSAEKAAAAVALCVALSIMLARAGRGDKGRGGRSGRGRRSRASRS